MIITGFVFILLIAIALFVRINIPQLKELEVLEAKLDDMR